MRRHVCGLLFVTGIVAIATSGCLPKSDVSHVANNGAPIANPEQSTTVLLTLTTDQGTATCSSTIVNSHPKLVTAGHCVTQVKRNGSFRYVEKLPARAIRATVLGKEVVATHIEVSLDFINAWNKVLASGKDWDNSLARFDTAVVTLPYGTKIPGTMPISSDQAQSGDPVGIAGFGQNTPLDQSGAGTLNGGTNTIQGVDDGIITTTGPIVTDAADGQTVTAPGDSGGTLSSNGQLVGVVSGGSVTTDASGNPIDTGTFNDLTNSPGGEFVQNQLKPCECGLNNGYCMIWRPGESGARGWYQATTCSVSDCQTRFANVINTYCAGQWRHKS